MPRYQFAPLRSDSPIAPSTSHPRRQRSPRHLGTDHTAVHVGDAEAIEVIPDLADIWDEPFADVSQIPTYLVSRVARRDVTVSLSGDGGDELFAGYNRHAWLDRVWGRAAVVPAGARRTAGSALGSIPPAVIERAARATRIFPAGLAGAKPIDQGSQTGPGPFRFGPRGRLSGPHHPLG
jgi:hypothetical protein